MQEHIFRDLTTIGLWFLKELKVSFCYRSLLFLLLWIWNYEWVKSVWRKLSFMHNAL